MALTLSDPLIEDIVALVRKAGAAILDIYQTDFEVVAKADASPLTQADLAAHREILTGLDRLTPNMPTVSEEAELPPFEQRRSWRQYWLIDPLDGTREFVGRNGQFTVNVALIDSGRPVFGVVGVPIDDTVYVGDVVASSAWCVRGDVGTREPLATRRLSPSALTVVASRSHGSDRLEAYLSAIAADFPNMSRQPVGSSLKLCLLAAGQADLYPRLGPTNEWDIAAAHAVLLAAGGELWTSDGKPMAYNAKPSPLNPEFIAVADPAYPWRQRLPPFPPGAHHITDPE